MTPAELNHWAATDVMGWTPEVFSYGLIYWNGSVSVSRADWNPDKDHNQCQWVIEKAIEKGVDARNIAIKLSECSKTACCSVHVLLATAGQKLRAVHAAWKGMDKE